MYFKVMKSGTNRKLVYDFLLVHSIVTFAVYNSVYEKFDVKQFNDFEISPRSSIFVSPESRRMISY